MSYSPLHCTHEVEGILLIDTPCQQPEVVWIASNLPVHHDDHNDTESGITGTPLSRASNHGQKISTNKEEAYASRQCSDKRDG